jgi:hypothetical protein
LLLRPTREPENLDIRNRPLRRFLGGCHHEIADAAALQFGCAPDQFEGIRRDTGFDACGSLSFG